MTDTFDEIIKMTNEAQSVIQMIQHSGCAPLMDGAFFRTFNDSLVFVSVLQQRIDIEAKLPEMLQDILGTQLEEILESRKKEAEKKSRRWRAAVLEGGHGIKEIVGEKPGESYMLNEYSHFDLDGGSNKRYAQALSMSLRVQVCHLSDVEQLKLQGQP